MSRAAVLAMTAALVSCGSGSPQSGRIPDIRLVVNLGTPELADRRIREFARAHDLAVYDTMIGLDGYTNYFLGNEDAQVLFLPEVDCPRPTSSEFWMHISVAPETPDTEWTKVEAVGSLVRSGFSPAPIEPEDRPACP